jgi:hypothetical protein
MSESIKVVLAGKEYTVKRLNIGQMADLSIGVLLPDNPDPVENVRVAFRRTLSVIATGIRLQAAPLVAEAKAAAKEAEDNDSLGRLSNGTLQSRVLEALYWTAITKEELRNASDAILEFSGLVPAAPAAAPPADAPPGESAGAA